MKKLTMLVALIVSTHIAYSQQNYYDTNVGNGYGFRFWGGSEQYKISMANTSDYQYGTVSDYSIKTNMNSGAIPGRGFTWGLYGATPIASLNALGQMQIAGYFNAVGNVVNIAPSQGWIALSGDLPGYANNTYPTLRTSANYLYFSTNNRYSAYLGEGNTVFALQDATVATKVVLATAGPTYFNGGNVGIGTSTPSEKFYVAGGAVALDADQPLRGGGKWLISGNSTQVTVGAASNATNLRFDAGTSNRMFINGTSGFVGIGTGSPDQLLTVKGTVHAQEVKIDLSVPGPDYVFEKDYKLPSIEELRNYIAQKKHLPEVPSAEEMEKNGVNVGEMNMILLKKIEELTLYIIELEQRTKALEGKR